MYRFPLIFLLILSSQGFVKADANFVKKRGVEHEKIDTETINSSVENPEETEPKITDSDTDKKELKQKLKKIEPIAAINRYEIEGYVNSNRVRIVIEVDKDQQVVGNIYSNKGVRTYMYGEYINGAFELYDQKGGHYRILMAD